MKHRRTTFLTLSACTALAATVAVAPTAAAAGPDTPLRKQTESLANQPAVAASSAAKAGAKGRNAPDIAAQAQTLVADGALAASIRAENGRRAYVAAAGKQSPGGHDAKPQDSFRIASNSKMMVATVVLQQVQAGRWSLGTTVESVVPGLLPGHGDITVEELLSHTSGLPDGVGTAISRNMANPLDLTQAPAALNRAYQPRDLISGAYAEPWGTRGKFLYSNTGYVVLGEMLKKATGRSLNQLLETGVFKPAGMNHTYLATTPGMPRHSLRETAVIGTTKYSLAGFNPSVFGAAGAVVSTTSDVNKFTQALVTGKLLNQRMLAQMSTPRSTGYGLGLMQMPDPCQPGKTMYGHNGATFGTFSWVVSSRDGKRQVALAVTQRYLDKPAYAQPYDYTAAMVAAMKRVC